MTPEQAAEQIVPEIAPMFGGHHCMDRLFGHFAEAKAYRDSQLSRVTAIVRQACETAVKDHSGERTNMVRPPMPTHPSGKTPVWKVPEEGELMYLITDWRRCHGSGIPERPDPLGHNWHRWCIPADPQPPADVPEWARKAADDVDHHICGLGYNSNDSVIAGVIAAHAAPLMAEVRDAIQDATSGWRYLKSIYGHTTAGVGWERVQDKLDTLLAALSESEVGR